MTSDGTTSDGTVTGPDGRPVLASRVLGGREVSLCRARAEDVAAIAALLADDEVAAGRDGIRSPEDLAAYRRAFDLVDADPAHLLVTGWCDGRLVATAQLTRLPGLSRRGTTRMLVEAVRVHGSCRGRGVGTFLLEWVIDEARRQGCGLLQLTTGKQRVDARRFYARLGFEASHEGLKLPLQGGWGVGARTGA